MNERKYYEAYDDRYRQVHSENLQWFAEKPSPIVSQIMDCHAIRPSMRILEIGCGEGRDARPLLKQGYDVLATDISPEAICYCRKLDSQNADRYQILDCLHQHLDMKFDFIYTVAVIHMLVLDQDRAKFYQFIRDHLSSNGIALICTMGDGSFERQSDISTAFELQPRTHEESGKTLQVAGTSCRIVNFPSFEAELQQNNLQILEKGTTSIDTIFSSMMYAVVKGETRT